MPLKIEIINQTSLKISAPAKINLFLEVLNKRPDGFHNLNGLFQAVSLYDHLTFELTDSPEVELVLTNKSLTNQSLTRQSPLPLDRTNLIVRAWEAVREFSPHSSGLRVRLEKNIPIAAGLGGGSADAAATIMAANLLLKLGLKLETLAEIGLKVGSDIPFFFGTGQAVVSGRGEILTDSCFPTDYLLILVTPNLAISTAKAYASLRIGLTKTKEPFSLNRCSTVMDFVVQIRNSVNDFERAHFLSYPVLGKIKDGLLEIGASMVRMSGSGPTMFGLFVAPPDLTAGIPNAGDDWTVNTARPVAHVNND